MPDSVEPTHEALLRLCADAAPKPWYPRLYAQSSGVDRYSLDIPLNDLRLAGLIQLTEWEPSTGQGYILTDLGKEVLNNSAFLEQFKASLQPPLVEPATADVPDADEGAPTTFQRGEVARKGYYEPEPPRVMPVLLILNLLAFGVAFVAAIRMAKPLNDFIFNGNAEVVHAVGALEASDLLHDEWWRLLTCCFLHFGLLHLSVNMYALYVLGGLEALWGSTRFLIIYVLSGLGGSCAAMIFNPGSPTEPVVLAGASGALWGLMLSLFVWVWLNRKHLPPQEVSARLRQYLFIILLNIMVSTLPHVSASAHLGGGIVGALTATLLHYHRFSVSPRRTGLALMIALLPILCFETLIEVMDRSSQWKTLIEADQRREEIRAQHWFKDKVVPAVDKATVYKPVDTSTGWPKDKVVPAVDKATAALTAIQRKVEIATDVHLKREPTELIDDLGNVTDLALQARKALEHDVPLPEREEQARVAGKEYMEATIEFGKFAQEWLKLDRVLDENERKTRRTAIKRLDEAREEWESKKNRL